MPEDPASQMKEKSDEELYEVVHFQREDWIPTALEAAERELQNRGLSAARLEALQTAAEAKKQHQEGIANEPLGTGLKVLFFLVNPATCIGLLVLVPVAEVVFRYRGYDRKYREAWKCMGYGFLLAIVLGVLLQILSLLEL